LGWRALLARAKFVLIMKLLLNLKIAKVIEHRPIRWGTQKQAALEITSQLHKQSDKAKGR
jgi:hypothetical protein